MIAIHDGHQPVQRLRVGLWHDDQKTFGMQMLAELLFAGLVM
jgi:hypothetical protein